MKKTGVLVVSFGTSFSETREKTLNVIEKEIKQAYAPLPVYNAWTSGVIRKKLLKETGEVILGPQEALEQIAAEGICRVLIQPTHMVNGFEHDKLCEAVHLKQGAFESIQVGKPLLGDESDYDTVIHALAHQIPVKEQEALVFMGHGTHHRANAVYLTLENRMKELGYQNFYMGTVESTPGFEDVFAQVQAQKVKKVILAPFLMVAGDHALNDLAGDEVDSWKSRFQAAGYEVSCVLKGLGEYPRIRQIILNHLDEIAGKMAK